MFLQKKKEKVVSWGLSNPSLKENHEIRGPTLECKYQDWASSVADTLTIGSRCTEKTPQQAHPGQQRMSSISSKDGKKVEYMKQLSWPGIAAMSRSVLTQK